MKPPKCYYDKITIAEKQLIDAGFNIDKTISIVAPNSKDSGRYNITRLCVDDTNKKFALIDVCIKGFLVTNSNIHYTINTYNYCDLISYEVYENGESIISGRAGSTVVGGLAFGALGAMAASAAKRTVQGTCSKMQIVLNVNNLQCPVKTIDILNYSIKKSSGVYANLISTVRAVTATFAFIQNQDITECCDKNNIPSVINESCNNNQKKQKENIISNIPTADKQSSSRQIEKSKWVSLFLCVAFGYIGFHKFYERKFGMGILYMLTFGLCAIGILVDIITIIKRPNPYYINI